MTDLRDRIICALLSLRCDLEEPCEDCRILACQDADAVIAELGLEVERGGTYEVGGEATSHRYVTDWVCEVNDGG